ncbi:muconolactone Delta-isomerase family protein [Dactylosporangium sp. NPDC048998]|uniref:muconolactone Delta-isomerase family protein n=1 Tax=Dactylosporangium sp. NPDC048998 TaxID=3363976 RepID=UPI0037102CF6
MPLFAVFTQQAPAGISADEFRHRLPEGFGYIQGLIDKGIIKHSWIVVGQSGGLNIYDVASHEELTDVLYGNPLASHLKLRVLPLSTPGGFDVEAFATRDLPDAGAEPAATTG